MRPEIVLLHGVQSSAATFWRVAPDLRDLGPAVRVIDLLGHGSRSAGNRPLCLATMAEDVAAQLGGVPVDLVVGHSMGALVALTLATTHPQMAGRLMLEDPPALGPRLDPVEVAADLERAAGRARAQTVALEDELRASHPLWARDDAAHHVAGLRSVDVAAVTGWLGRERWDLVALVKGCPVPVHLLVAEGPESATTEPARSEVIRYLGSGRVTELASGHSIHRDRPGAWVASVLRTLPPTTSLPTEGAVF